MSLAEELLAQSKTLARLESNKPKQASLRRAVSAAYYALFHLLVGDGARLFVRDDFARAALLSRTFDHSKMKEVSGQFLGDKLPERIQSKAAYQTPADLKAVAATFIKLQQLRHEADYNLDQQYSRPQVDQLIREVETAFASWGRVRNSDDARLYLSCFLLWDAWKKR